MSDEEVRHSKHKGKHRDEPPVTDKSTPEIINEGLFRWAESCFRGDEQANDFVVHQLLGRSGKVEGELVRRRSVKHLKEGSGVKREELVIVCNELMEEMQDEADQMHQPRRFVVVATNALKGVAFARKTIECEPKRLLMRGLGGGGGGDDADDIDPLGGDILRKRAETVLSDGRFYAEVLMTTVGGITKVLVEQLKGKDAQINELFQANMTLARANNEAENNKLDRDLVREEKQFILGAKRKGVAMLAGLLPDFLKKATAGAVDLPGGHTPESMAIEAIMDEKNGGLTGEERHKIFGDWTDAGECLDRGILLESQVRIIIGILNEKVPVTELDRLITEGSPEQFTQEQYMRIMAALGGDLDKLMPLVKILQDRKAALDKTAVVATTTSTTPPTQEK